MSGPQGNGQGGGQPNGAQPQGGSRRRGRRRKGGGAAGPDAGDLWRRVPDLDPVEPIVPVDETAATAMLRSLGQPPLPGQGNEVLLDLSKVVVRASQLASALAAAADLLEDGVEEDRDAVGANGVGDPDAEEEPDR